MHRKVTGIFKIKGIIFAYAIIVKILLSSWYDNVFNLQLLNGAQYSTLGCRPPAFFLLMRLFSRSKECRCWEQQRRYEGTTLPRAGLKDCCTRLGGYYIKKECWAFNTLFCLFFTWNACCFMLYYLGKKYAGLLKWLKEVAQWKTIDYCFLQVKPPKARSH